MNQILITSSNYVEVQNSTNQEPEGIGFGLETLVSLAWPIFLLILIISTLKREAFQKKAIQFTEDNTAVIKENNDLLKEKIRLQQENNDLLHRLE